MEEPMSEMPVPGARTGLNAPWAVWTGRVLSAVPVLLMVFSASLKLMRNPTAEQMLSGKFGYPPASLFTIGVLETACVVLYLVPRTAVLGAILMTAYLGAVVATHVRVGDVFAIPVLLGVLVWAGLYLRDPRIRTLVPLRDRLAR
jgi:hypothetical protein